MSLRDAINLRRRKSGIITMVGFALFTLGGMASSANRSFIALSLLGFLMFGGGMLYHVSEFAAHVAAARSASR